MSSITQNLLQRHGAEWISKNELKPLFQLVLFIDDILEYNLHSIKSVPLLEELINYNDTGNFDRVIAFMLTIVNVQQNQEK